MKNNVLIDPVESWKPSTHNVSNSLIKHHIFQYFTNWNDWILLWKMLKIQEQLLAWINTFMKTILNPFGNQSKLKYESTLEIKKLKRIWKIWFIFWKKLTEMEMIRFEALILMN